MKYNQPYDQPTFLEAPYVNNDPVSGVPGSIPSAAAFEYPQRELVNFIEDNLLDPSNLDLHQLSRSLQNSAVIYGVDVGTANAIQIALDPIPTALTAGMTVRIKKGLLSNSGPVTIDIGVGANNLKRADGTDFVSGELSGNIVFEATWDGTSWLAINFLAREVVQQTITNNFSASIPYCVDTSTTANTIIAPFNPALTQLVAGNLVLVKLNRAFATGPTIILVNALPAVGVKRGDGIDPLSGDGYVGQVLLLEFDGMFFQIVNSVVPRSPIPIVIADRKPAGTPGGSFVAGAWRTRDLNEVICDPYGMVTRGLVSLGGNRITLSAGRWIVHARAPYCYPVLQLQHAISWFGTDTQLRFYNTTDGTQLIKGHFHSQDFEVTNAAFSAYEETAYAYLDGEIELTEPKVLELQQIISFTVSTNGFGISAAQHQTWLDGNGGDETYSVLELWRVS